MGQTVAIGRVTEDLVMQNSGSYNSYIRFSLRESIGYGKTARSQFYQVWAFGNDAVRLLRGKVKRGSLIMVTGQLELESFEREDKTRDKRLKLTLGRWEYIPLGSSPGNTTGNDVHPEQAAQSVAASVQPPVREIDGDKEVLPE